MADEIMVRGTGLNRPIIPFQSIHININREQPKKSKL